MVQKLAAQKLLQFQSKTGQINCLVISLNEIYRQFLGSLLCSNLDLYVITKFEFCLKI